MAPSKAELKFGHRLKEVRKAHGETQQQLADLIAVDQSQVARWEAGQGPRADQMLRLMRHYHADTAYLLFGNAAERLFDSAPAETLAVLAKFLETPLGKSARARGLMSVLSSIEFKNTPDVQTYARVARALMGDPE